MAPYAITELFGHWGANAVYVLIGFAFGAVLEMSGFGNSMKLAAQFYLKEMTVLKVMFTAIVVAMLLIFLTSAAGLLDFNLVWVPPTYLWPGIAGGLLMGVGFIIGGFCPGTSLVSAATLKIDGIFFVLGASFGIFLFGETIQFYDGFFNSSNLGRLILPDLFGVDAGVVVIAVTLMALVMFWGAEQLERIFGHKDPKAAPRWRYGAAGAALAVALAVLILGQPTAEQRWQRIAAEKQLLLDQRAVQIHPGELLSLIEDPHLQVVMLDVRTETDYNLFHILDARHAPLSAVAEVIPELHDQPANTVFVVMSNDEVAATEAWKVLAAESVPNTYILEGGVNRWLDVFANEEFRAEYQKASAQPDQLRYIPNAALGSRLPAAEPNAGQVELEFIPKVQLEMKRGPSGGGCG
ncbi:MAG: YeeE/YedE thiosulfate transporter family protein [Chloroflexota bacterium]|nr:YeeE/YedE thiosulfate transporter family protein [Chloroflexota bacterium]